MKNKVIVFLLLTISFSGNLKSQDNLKPGELFIYYEDVIYRIVAEPTHTFHQNNEDINKIHITDSVFVKYIDSMIVNMKTKTICNYPSVVYPGMIQIVYRRNNCKYYTINMTHSLTNEIYYGKIGMLELDGQMMEYNSKFQDVIDQVVNYHIRNPKFKIDNASFLREILEGKRYEHDINLN